MGLVLGTWQFVYLGVAIPAGKLIDRLGLRWSILLAGASIGLSALLRATAQGLPSLLLAVAIFGIGAPLISIGAPKLVADYFATQGRRVAVGIYGTGPAIGSALGLAATNGVVMPLVEESWRGAMVIGAVPAVAGIGIWLMVSMRPGPAASTPSVALLSSAALLRLPIVRLVLVLGIGGFFYIHALANWLVDILESAGWSVVAAGYWASVPTLLGIVATLTLPRLATGERRASMLGWILIIGAIALLFVSTTSTPVLVPALAASGLARSMIMPLCMLILMDARAIGSRNIAAVGGLFFTAAEIGGVLGPIVTGLLADLTDGFGLAIVTLSAALAAMAALVHVRLRPMLAAEVGLDGPDLASNSSLR